MTDPAATADAAHSPRFPVGAAIAAWILPGLGHIILGQRRRGFLLLCTILSLYIAGLLIGGIDVIDSREDRLWYYGQILAGPHTLAIDRVHQAMRADTYQRWQRKAFGNRRPPDAQTYPYKVSIARVNELGTLYCTMAGLLNLLAIIDVLFRMDHARRSRPEPALRGRVVAREGVEGAGP